MKTTVRFCTLILITLTTLNAHALLVKLDRPGIALSAGFPEAARKQIQSALDRADCKFLGGQGLNSHTSLNYSSDTKALNLFLDDLAKCPGTTVSLSFTSDALPDANSDWHVSHMADGNRFHIRVSLRSTRIKLDQLVIPEAKGPPIEK